MKKHQALITGASRGIGAAIAAKFRSRGWSVLTPSRHELNLLDLASIENYLKTPAVQGVDVLVNNAGINIIESIENLSDDHWAQMIQTNLTAPMKLIQGVAPRMKAQKWGRVVNISSVFSLVTKEKRAAYSSTKSGLNGLTRTLAVELAPHQILVNSLCPGYVDTELTHQNNSPEDLAKIVATVPMGRMALPEEMAEMVAFLCSEENTYMTGQTVVVDGGFSLK